MRLSLLEKSFLARLGHWLCRPGWLSPALLLAFTLFFYWKILFTNRISFPWDALGFFYPYLSYVHEELRHFRLPLWTPYAFSGFPIIGDPEAQIFYPPNWLFVLIHPFSPMPFKLVEIQIILHFFLAGLFMFYLAKDFTGHRLPAWFGGVLFMASGTMVAHTEHLATINAMAWYPLVFLLARRGLLEGRLFWTVCAGFFFGIENLTGHFQHAVYLGLLLFLYFAYEACVGPLRSRLWPRWIAHLSVIALLGAALAMVQILSTSQLKPLSIRSRLTYWDVTGGNDPDFLLTLLLPNYFGGLNGVPYRRSVEPSFNHVFLTVPGLLLALVGLIEMARRRNLFWLGIIVVFAELSFGRNGYLVELIYRIPLLNLFRGMPFYFNLSNFGLCLMAAVGMQTLADINLRGFYRKFLPIALIFLLVVAIALSPLVQLLWMIPGWYHMLVVLALFSVLVAAMLSNRLPTRLGLSAICGFAIFQLCFYNMNQVFNSSRNDPRTQLTFDYIDHRKQSLEFLRSDGGDDFRVAAIAGEPWTNGSLVWRIPGIYGWNPIMLRDYQEYIRQFTHIANYAAPHGGPDHHLESPLLDLLGVKYVVVPQPDEEEQRLSQSAKFEKVFTDYYDWWNVYRNPGYLSRAWFFPRAYVVSDRAQVLPLMNSRWFQARRTLIFAREDLGTRPLPRLEELAAIPLPPDQVAAASNGRPLTDPYCAEPRLMYAEWSGQGSWIRFDISAPLRKGRYLLLAEYTAAIPVQPALAVDVAQGEHRQSSLVILPRTHTFACEGTRSAELGEFEMSADTAQITLTLQADSAVNLFSLWLVQLPETAPPAAGEFSFSDFSVSANQIGLRVRSSLDGFVLLNEIYYPGWEARLDGQLAEILRADGIFRALAVPAGSHRIELRFRPPYFALGAAVSLITLTLFGAYVTFPKHRRIAIGERADGKDGAGLC